MVLTWELRWPDGSVLCAPTATEALALLADEQMRPCATVDEMRDRLVDRCFVWMGVFIDQEEMDDAAFLEALGDAGLIKVITHE